MGCKRFYNKTPSNKKGFCEEEESYFLNTMYLYPRKFHMSTTSVAAIFAMLAHILAEMLEAGLPMMFTRTCTMPMLSTAPMTLTVRNSTNSFSDEFESSLENDQCLFQK